MPKGNPARLEKIRELQQYPWNPPFREYGISPEIHPTASIGNEGFGYEWDAGSNRYLHFPHRGGVIIGNYVRIGAHACIDRGSETDTKIGSDTKIDNLVHIAHNVQIGEHCLIVAGVVVGGSAKIGDRCFIGMNASIKEHVTIGNDVTIGAGSVVLCDVPDGETWAGVPAKKIK